VASWIFRRDHPSRPKAMICCFFSSFKTFAMLREAKPAARSTILRSTSSVIQAQPSSVAGRAGNGDRRDLATIEHLNFDPPFYVKDGLRTEDIAICCFACNASRGNRRLWEGFTMQYCRGGAS